MGWKWKENQTRSYFLDKIHGFRMERKPNRLLLPILNKWVGNGKKIKEAVTY